MTDKKPLTADTSTKHRFHLAILNPIATTGTWAWALTSNILNFAKAAAATTSVVNVAVPTTGSKGGTFGGNSIKSLAFEYDVGALALTSAPTAILNKITVTRSSGAQTRAAVDGALAFTGFDTTGVGIGGHVATFTPTDNVAIDDEETLVLSFTMNEAATSTLAAHALTVETN